MMAPVIARVCAGPNVRPPQGYSPSSSTCLLLVAASFVRLRELECTHCTGFVDKLALYFIKKRFGRRSGSTSQSRRAARNYAAFDNDI